MLARPGNSPHEVDVHVGRRVRLQRRALNISQAALADRLGLTFQQVQKYERGSNRISASKLHEIAIALEVPVGYFFIGLPGTNAAEGSSNRTFDAVIDRLMSEDDGAELAEAFPKVRSAPVRRAIVKLIRAMVTPDP